ncbi:hypothetical protein JCM11641_006271 [Rhodosporidiobolus odoratus]
MTGFLSSYLCCCLGRSSPIEHSLDPERQPLLNPDVLPAPPPRLHTRSTQEQQREQESLNHILNLASDRIINISNPNFLTPTLTSTSHSRIRTRVRTTSSSSSGDRPASTWRADPDEAPLAPVRARVVTLGPNWEEALSPSRHEDGEPSRIRDGRGKSRVEGIGRLDQGKARRGGTRRSRPPSSHSMRTLTGRGGTAAKGVGQPSPLRRGAQAVEDDEEELAEDGSPDQGEDAEEEDEGNHDDDEPEDDDESLYNTVASYRTARSRYAGSTIAGSYLLPEGQLRDMWETEDGDEEANEQREEELRAAIAKLELDIDSWTLPNFGPFIAELGGDLDSDKRN